MQDSANPKRNVTWIYWATRASASVLQHVRVQAGEVEGSAETHIPEANVKVVMVMRPLNGHAAAARETDGE